VYFLGHPDDPRDFQTSSCTIDPARVGHDLRTLDLAPRLVVTHNDRGEYGHPHHVMTHRVVSETYPECPMLYFGFGKEKPHLGLDAEAKWTVLKPFYQSQAEIIRKFEGRRAESFVWRKPPHER